MFVSKVHTHKPKGPFVEVMTALEQNTLANNAACLRAAGDRFAF